MPASRKRNHTQRRRHPRRTPAPRHPLHDHELFISSILENIPDMIFVKDAAELRFVRFNRAGEELLGRKSSDLIGKNDYDFFPKQEADFFTNQDRAVLDNRKMSDIPEEPIHTLKKGLRYLHTKKIPILDAAGNPKYLLGISEDITEKKHAAEALRKAYDDLETRVQDRTAELMRVNHELRRMQAEIQKFNAELEEKVALRTAELTASNQELEAFTYSVSHDLRAPLRAIEGFAQILLETQAATLDEEGARLLGKVVKNALQMSKLIDDLLAFSRIGKHNLVKQHVSMETLVRSVFDELSQLESNRHVELHLPPLPEAWGDAVLLRQVWMNLLSNAFKFSRARSNPRIEVGASVEGQEIAYHIRDNGVGFPSEYAGNLFGVFVRLHSSEEFEGTGVGLAIVRRIIQKHSGRTWAESQEGEGAVFHFSLPQEETDQ